MLGERKERKEKREGRRRRGQRRMERDGIKRDSDRCSLTKQRKKRKKERRSVRTKIFPHWNELTFILCGTVDHFVFAE